MELLGAVALITGPRRIGDSVATSLARERVDIGLVYHASRDEARSTADRVESLGRRAFLVQADLREPSACQRAVDAVADEFGRLDILINMASTFRSVAFDQLTVDDWEANMQVDLRASWLCARAAVPHMRRQGRGHIINFSDWVAATGRPNVKGYAAYYVAKTGVIGLTQALALELAADQILVNAIAPGPIAPSAYTSEARVTTEARAVPLGRWGGEAQIATAVVGLLRNDFISGETLRVDGGRHLTEPS